MWSMSRFAGGFVAATIGPQDERFLPVVSMTIMVEAQRNLLGRAGDSLDISSSKGFANTKESFSSVDGAAMPAIRPHIRSELGGSSILAFEIFIVKTHLPPSYGI